MTIDQLSIFIILGVTLCLFVYNRWRFDVVALMALIASVFVGVVDPQEAFSGLGHPAVITVAAVLVLSRALVNSGLVDIMADYLFKFAKSRFLQILSLTVLAAVLSAFMNNIGALALLMPVAIATAHKFNYAPAAILMPLSFASILGGMTTLIGTPPNIIISQFRADAVGESFKMFDFSVVGFVLAVFGVGFLTLIGWRLIPKHRSNTSSSPEDLFDIADYVTEVRITKSSSLLGKTLRDFENEYEGKITLLELIRGEKRIAGWVQHEMLENGDILLIEADAPALKDLIAETGLEIVVDQDLAKDLRKDGLAIMEVVVAPDSWIIGRTAASLWLQRRHALNLLGISRHGQVFKERIMKVHLQAGDVLLLQGENGLMTTAISELGCLPLATRGLKFQPRQVFIPVLFFALGIFVAAIGWVPASISLTTAALALVVFGILPVRDIYESIDWSVIVLLAAMIPIGGALQTSGATELLADNIIAIVGNGSPLIMMLVVLVITMMLSDIMNNAATVVVMAPISIGIAQSLGVSIDPFLMAVAIGGSSAFLTPIGHQNNTLIMGPGGYRFGDYWRVGLPLEILIVIVSAFLIPGVWPF